MGFLGQALEHLDRFQRFVVWRVELILRSHMFQGTWTRGPLVQDQGSHGPGLRSTLETNLKSQNSCVAFGR